MSGWLWDFVARARRGARPARVAAGLWLMAVAVAACASQTDDEQITGALCGPAVCGDAEYCCDARCGLCVPQEIACRDTCPGAQGTGGGGM
jgi:hypothetical protein